VNLERLTAVVREEGGLPDEAVVDPPAAGEALHGPLAASGPRAAGREREYELLVEAIREGYLLHYGAARVVATDDPDLALLAGDRLYALGLARLAELGDLEAVGVLADVISLCAQAHASANPQLAEAVWEAGAAAVGWGAGPPWDEAAGRARAGDAEAVAALQEAARRLRGSAPNA
jgi:hypothetical protein